MQLSTPGSGFTATLQPSALTQSITLNLPTTGGTLLVTSGPGISTAWLLGGNDLTSAGPADNKLGTITANDVRLIANGNTLLTLATAGPAVVLRQGVPLQFKDNDASNTSSFVGGNQTVDINYTLPTVAPTAGQVLRANSSTPTNLEWGTTGGTNSILVYTKTADQADGGGWTVASGLSYTLSASTTYGVFGMINVKTSDATRDPQFRFGSPGTSSTISVFFAPFLASTASASTGTAFAKGIGVDNGTANFEKYFVTGTLTTSTTVAAADFEFNKLTGAPTITIGAGSYLMFIPD